MELGALEARAGKKRPIEIASVRVDENGRETAVVFVPSARSAVLGKKIRQYGTEVTPKKGEPKHKPLVERIETIAPAVLKSLWTDDPSKFPLDQNAKVWWEVWLWRPPAAEVQGDTYARFLEFAGIVGIRTAERRLQFEDRIVLLVEASPEELASSVDVLSGDIMEIRGASQVATPFDAMDAPEQVEWVAELIERTTGPDDDATAVCILDTGVNRGHLLLASVVKSEDRHSFQPENWGTADDHGHGTEMAGLATYGNLAAVLGMIEQVVLRHRIESVKILPPTGHNDPELYGTITAVAASRVEIQAPDRRRCFSLAITDDDQTDRGQPTSWSAAIDALATGRAFDETQQGFDYTTDADRDARRLFIVSAGNVSPEHLPVDEHMDTCDTSVVQDPAQAWNALSVGACTDLAIIDDNDPDLADYRPVARAGSLSPHSCTSVGFQRTKWPLKPDVVFEGGNVAHDGHGNVTEGAPDLTLLSTGTDRTFVTTWGTSAATAQVARMAAILQREYPALLPETIRGLIVHSARWTPCMMEGVGGDDWRRASKGDRETHVRRFGFGVPSLERAARSATDALTLLVERDDLRPFADKGSYGSYGDMHVFELPWPKRVLEELGEAVVRLRVTLSYFIEPNPARRGRLDRYSYQSHGLRFRVKRGAEESLEEFVKGLSKAALDEEEKKPEAVPKNDWFLGDQAERRGSILTNLWEGTAAELAHRSVVAVYGVAGWWKAQKRARESQAPYSLIVSIEADGEDVDIHTPVATEVGVPVAIDTIEL